ncbi:MAG: iron chelate uptake ABC transporter family permease subunit, partial [Arcanobacterium sp.]|nr:iron chelate uptake ABC transporter family permease subunit [Arcanobacterium sp.]
TASRWLTGSLNGASWARILPLIVVVTLFVPLLLILRAKLGVLQLGDELAIGLGLQTKIYRVFLIVGAVTLVAVATSACGPVSFVAFMAGPIAMRLSRNQGMPMLTAGLVGALIMIAADYSGQYFFGARYPVGVVTGLLGAPFLIYLLIRAQNRA